MCRLPPAVHLPQAGTEGEGDAYSPLWEDGGMTTPAAHWDSTYTKHGNSVSWYQEEPRVSLELFDALDVAPDVSVIDVGGGASTLVDELVARRFSDVSVLDVSGTALAETRRRLGDDASVDWLQDDVLTWQPRRRYGLWHDRALFHFLVHRGDRDTYLQKLRSTVDQDGAVVLATFAPDAPPSCSGLPVARYSAEGLVMLLGAGFEIVDARREVHVTPRGSVQPFTWVAGRICGSGETLDEPTAPA